MQEYTKLKLRALRDEYAMAVSKDWDLAASKLAERGYRSPPGMLNGQIQEIGLKHLDKLLEDLLAAEKTALSSAGSLPDDYFNVLKTELIEISSSYVQGIFDRLTSGFRHRSPLCNMSNICDAQKNQYASRVNIKVELLKEELKLKMNTGGETVIHVTGDVGVINTGTVYGAIHGKIERMKATPAAELAEIFDQLLSEIKNSSEHDDSKIALMEHVEMLASQHETSPEQRKRGWIIASYHALSVAGSLSTLWQQFGPIIKEAFKQYIP